MKKLISQVNNIFDKKIELNPTDIYICGISGGQDSVLIFIILLHLKKQWNISIQLLHFNHFWQKKNFYCNHQVWKLAFVFQTPFYIVLENFFLNSEKKAREWRQRGFERISSIANSNKIFTGHTASDRIETSFWHLIRGTSPQGFRSLRWQTNLVIQKEFFNAPSYIKNNFFIFPFYLKNKKHKKKYSKKRMKNIFHFIYSKKKKTSKLLLTEQKLFSNFCLKSVFIYKTTPKEKQTQKYYSEKFLFFKTNTIFSNYSFLVFKFSLVFFFEKKHQTVYTFLNFYLIFSKKTLFRPMLVFHRNDITLFSKKYSLPIISDPSNDKLCWSRNRIRHQLLPLLRFFFNPQTESLLNNFLEIMNQEQNYINYLIEKLIGFWLKQPSKWLINDYRLEKKLIKNQFNHLPNAIKKRLVQKLFQSHANFYLNFVQIEIIVCFIQKN